MAKQYSEDTATAASGGDMGLIQRDKVVPPIVNAANSLEPGQVSNILVTPSGVEIIKVESKRAKPFEEVKPALETQLRQSKAEEIVQRLADNYHLVIDQEYFAGSPVKQNSPASPQPLAPRPGSAATILAHESGSKGATNQSLDAIFHRPPFFKGPLKTARQEVRDGGREEAENQKLLAVN